MWQASGRSLDSEASGKSHVMLCDGSVVSVVLVSFPGHSLRPHGLETKLVWRELHVGGGG